MSNAVNIKIFPFLFRSKFINLFHQLMWHVTSTNLQIQQALQGKRFKFFRN
uniref:Uncharacterized protein n=1 Tax=Rhizophora mucronata TaxID=61149 RepID=A0A2P2P2E7_RHIMU